MAVQNYTVYSPSVFHMVK